MVAVPGAIAVTMPSDDPIVAMPGDPDVHVPPGYASESVVVIPSQIASGPDMGGAPVTVTVAITLHPATV